jgi:hypothetical protein
MPTWKSLEEQAENQLQKMKEMNMPKEERKEKN